MLISELPIHVPPSLARVFGFNEAAVIQEIHFWLNPNVGHHFSLYFKDDRYWVPDIFEHLYQKFSFWDEDTIAYMCAEFEQSGILMMREGENSSQDLGTIIYHTLNYEVLREIYGVKADPSSSSIDERVPILDPAANENINTQSFFLAEIHKSAPDVYAMEVQDLPHFLACELLLEIQDRTESVQDGLPPREVICHFPKIFDVELKEFIWGDATLYKIVMVTFQMNILQEILSFCEAHKASKIEIFADNDDELGIYKDFLAYEDECKKSIRAESKEREVREEKRGIVIPVNRETLDAWAGFMKSVTIRFRKMLRNGQKTNPAIQNYLKLLPLPE